MDWPTQRGTFEVGELSLKSGAVLRNARLSWKAHGTLSAARDNVVVYPTSYGAQLKAGILIGYWDAPQR